MSDPLKPLLSRVQEFFYSAPPQKTAYETIELRHPSFVAPARVVNDPRAISPRCWKPTRRSTRDRRHLQQMQFPLHAAGKQRQPAELPDRNRKRLRHPDALSRRSGRHRGTAANELPAVLLRRSHRARLRHQRLDRQTRQRPAFSRSPARSGFEDFLGRAFPLRFYNLTDFPGLAQMIAEPIAELGFELLSSAVLWHAGANRRRGRIEFDCWGLARHVQRELFGRELPPPASSPAKSKARAR